MSSKKAVDALRHYRAEQSQRKQQNVLQAIEDLTNDGKDITIASVSRAAQVSREFIHSHHYLHSAVRQAAQPTQPRTAAAAGPAEANVTRGLRADREMLLGRIERQRAQIAEQQARLQEHDLQRQRWFGAQLAGAQAVDPEAHAELRTTNERVIADNMTLTRQVAELRRLINVLQGDLAASRQAHEEDLRILQKEPPAVIQFDRKTTRL
ncbi:MULTISPECIES: DUF6262 family protein [Arthrobacter]|uniref:Uncharacterized protein n=1 Tax=Arthrobacter terricola TaxID=2547396 RepID=A0A4V2ZRP3_9MICC|nr:MULTISPECIES: DUF6262 family protein [Arthrobacter]MBT8159637.1 hypothetical protein [Arthrobacter sp. GN70]TDF87514.1 hypothetical protein E1809_24825 [Arthrobacter terricola]